METQITFRGMPRSDALDSYVRTRADKLTTFYERITTCRVAVEEPHKHAHQGRKFRVRIDLMVPGGELVVTGEPDANDVTEDAYAAVDTAFEEAGRQLDDYARRQRGEVKPHEHHRRGVVKKLFSYEGYGFLESAEGEEIYFHRNAVLDHAFERMKIGSKVSFVDEMGEKGPQASTVTLRRSP